MSAISPSRASAVVSNFRAVRALSPRDIPEYSAFDLKLLVEIDSPSARAITVSFRKLVHVAEKKIVL